MCCFSDNRDLVCCFSDNRDLTCCFSDNKDKMCELEPGKTILYTWDDPLKKRELVWSCGNEKNHKDLLVEVGETAHWSVGFFKDRVVIGIVTGF